MTSILQQFKNPQGSDPSQLYLWAQDFIRTLRKGLLLNASTDIIGALFAQTLSLSAATTTIGATDTGKLIINFNANRTVNLPAAAPGLVYGFYTLDGGSGGNLIVTPAFGNMLFPDGESLGGVTMRSNQSMIIVANGTSNWIVIASTFNLPGETPAVSVFNFGADPTGVADSTTAIQNAINSLPVTGGRVFFPTGSYKISSTIAIGNGTSSAFSTRSGVVLIGEGQPTWELDADTSPTRLVWAGATNGIMVSINGPLRGWGIQNMFFSGANIAGITALKVTSAMLGDCRNLGMKGVWHGIDSRSFEKTGGLAGASNTDSTQNMYYNTFIWLHDQATSVPIAVLLTGSGAATPTSNTDFNVFNGLALFVDGAVNASFGIYLQVCDSCTFHNVHVSSVNLTNFISVNFGYSDVNTNFPNSCKFFGIDPGAANKMAAGGTAAVGDNVIYGLMKGNGGNVQTLSGVTFV